MHPHLSTATNRKLALVDQLLALLERRPDCWPAVSPLARSRSFILTDSLEDKIRMALDCVEHAIGETEETHALRRALGA